MDGHVHYIYCRKMTIFLFLYIENSSKELVILNDSNLIMIIIKIKIKKVLDGNVSNHIINAGYILQKNDCK